MNAYRLLRAPQASISCGTPRQRMISAISISAAIALALLATLLVVLTIRWPWIHDTEIFHYILLLLRSGFRPYIDIIDINFPGSYLQEWIGVSLFGSSDLGWRLYDASILGVVCLCFSYITKPTGRSLGVVAAVTFATVHLADGPWYMGERDLFVTALIAVAYVCVLRDKRKRFPLNLFLASFCLGVASVVKPFFAPLIVVLIGIPIWQRSKERSSVSFELGSSITGFLAPLTMVALWLVKYKALTTFIDSSRVIGLFYQTIPRPSFTYLLRHMLPLPLVPVFLLFVGLRFRLARRVNLESDLILLGVLFCVLDYFVQGKGYIYHRYPLVALALLWGFVEIGDALHEKTAACFSGVVGILFVVTLSGPYLACQTLKIRSASSYAHPWDEVTRLIMSDLENQGGSALSGKVQCFDTDAGCYGALFRLRLVSSTGLMGDHLLFWPKREDAVQQMRRRMLAELIASPPQVIVLTNKWFSVGQSFDLLDSWPEFKIWLLLHYVLVNERSFGLGTLDPHPVAYRIYRRCH